MVDEGKHSRLVILKTNSLLEQMKLMVIEDYGTDHCIIYAKFSLNIKHIYIF